MRSKPGLHKTHAIKTPSKWNPQDQNPISTHANQNPDLHGTHADQNPIGTHLIKSLATRQHCFSDQIHLKVSSAPCMDGGYALSSGNI